MTDPGRPPSSAAIHAQPSSIPASRQPSVASRGSRSSLQRQDAQPPASSSASPQPQEPQPAPATSPPEPHEPTFAPLFALLTSTSHPSQKPTLHHPTMHYIFADDDPEILTEALARHHRTAEEFEGDDPESDQGASQEAHPRPSSSSNSGINSNSGSRDRAILLDLAPAAPGGPGRGFEVSWASSLTPDWAVMGARIAGRVDEDDGPSPPPATAQHQRDGALILRVEGVAVEEVDSTAAAPHPPAQAKAPPHEGGELQSPGVAAGANRPQPQPHQRSSSEEYTSLMDEFEKRMDVMRRVVDAGEERRRKTEADPLAADDAAAGDADHKGGNEEEEPRRQSGSD